MKKIYTIILTAAALFAGCEEFQPVFTGKYPDPQEQYIYTDDDFGGSGNIKTIAEAKALYKANGDKPYKVESDFVIKGKVSTSDQVGNLYKTLYIQDETAGIEIKIGKNGLYNEYKVGQTLYVQLEDLTVGDYNGMINIGYGKDKGSKYETSYIDHYQIIDTHIFKGEYGDPVEPVVVPESSLFVKDAATGSKVANPLYLGKLVTLTDLTYSDMVFILAYIDYNGDHEDYNGNCIFIDEEWPNNNQVTTWAMSEQLWKQYLYSGIFDDVEAGVGTVASYKEEVEDSVTGETKVVYNISNSAYSVSQYFQMPENTSIQVRSSGYARFSDTEIPAEVINGASVTFTGILTVYKGELQMTLIDLSGVKKADGSPWYN